MKKTSCVIIFALLFSSLGFGQNETFVYRADNKFFIDCQEFYPMILNYSLLYEDSAGHYRITPTMNQCKMINGCNSCGVSKEEYRNVIADQLKTIVKMGFNTLRFVGMAVHFNGEKNEMGGFSGNLATNSYYEFGHAGADKQHCHKFHKNGKSLTGIQDYQRQGDLMEQLFSIIRQENLPLKVLFLAGGHGVEVRSTQYAQYLSYLAERFRSEPILLGYDLYNEPEYFHKMKGKDITKYDRAKWFNTWYEAIKSIAPWQFVTYGPVISDIFNWDPEVMPADFISYHIYSHPKENYNWDFDTAFIAYKSNLKYVSENISKPWILGETGQPGVNRELYRGYEIHPIVSSEEEQRTFVEKSLKYVRWYGGGGYAHWLFKDGIWSKKNMDTQVAKQYFLGLVNFRENNTWKPAAYEFQKFDPSSSCSECTNPSEKDYYNLFFFKYPIADGHVFLKSGNMGSSSPYKGALIHATVGLPGSKDKNHSFLTFSDEKGKFTIRSKYKNPDMIVKSVRMSGPGMSNVYLENWSNGLAMEKPFYLSKLNASELPQFAPVPEQLNISKKDITWNGKRLLLESTLIIEKGAVLTISDTLYVKPGTIIKVKDGGVLELNGAIIGLCSWDGIEVIKSREGKKRKKNQGGRIILGEDYTIENSQNMIRYINE